MTGKKAMCTMAIEICRVTAWSSERNAGRLWAFAHEERGIDVAGIISKYLINKKLQ